MNELDGTVMLVHTVRLEDLVDDLTTSALTHDELYEFIMALDLAVADLSFTERLYAALGDAIRTELEENE